MNRFPLLSTATATGELNCALMANPPSPEYPALLLPAMRVMTPFGSSLKMHSDAAKKMLPEESAATAEGHVKEAFVPTAGVGGGAPPATVETTYCCAPAAWTTRSKAICRGILVIDLGPRFKPTTSNVPQRSSLYGVRLLSKTPAA